MRVMAKSRAYWKKWFSLSSPFNVTEWQEFPYCGRGLIFLTPYLIWSWEKFPQCIWMRVHNSWLNHSMSLTQPQSPNPKTYLPVTVIKLNNIKNVKNTNPSIATLHISLSQRQPLSSRHTHPSWMFPLDFPQTHLCWVSSSESPLPQLFSHIYSHPEFLEFPWLGCQRTWSVCKLQTQKQKGGSGRHWQQQHTPPWQVHHASGVLLRGLGVERCSRKRPARTARLWMTVLCIIAKRERKHYESECAAYCLKEKRLIQYPSSFCHGKAEVRDWLAFLLRKPDQSTDTERVSRTPALK